MLVEEVPPKLANKGSTVYFSSTVNLTARPFRDEMVPDQDNGSEKQQASAQKNRVKSRPKVNYNLTYLMNVQTQTSDERTAHGSLKSAAQIQIERLVSRRLHELNKENNGQVFELPKNFADSRSIDKKNSRMGNTASTKRILSSRRTLASYFEEERNPLAINSILGLNYQFVEELDTAESSKRPKIKRSLVKRKLKLCCICGQDSAYARCDHCGLFACSVRCNKMHLESRCT